MTYDGKPHVLTVKAWEDPFDGPRIEYTLEHPDCQGHEIQAFKSDEDAHTIDAETYSSETWECGVGMTIQDAGFLDSLGVIGIEFVEGQTHRYTRHLEPGRYYVEFWAVTHPSTPNGPEEYDAGITLTPIPENEPYEKEQTDGDVRAVRRPEL